MSQASRMSVLAMPQKISLGSSSSLASSPSCSSYRSLPAMAFWKMAGLEVMQTLPLSIFREPPPLCMSSRESSSTQGACPSSCILRKRSFTSTSLCGPYRQSTPAWQTREPWSCHQMRGDLPLWVLDQTPQTALAQTPNREPGLRRDPATESEAVSARDSTPSAYLRDQSMSRTINGLALK